MANTIHIVSGCGESSSFHSLGPELGMALGLSGCDAELDRIRLYIMCDCMEIGQDRKFAEQWQCKRKEGKGLEDKTASSLLCLGLDSILQQA